MESSSTVTELMWLEWAWVAAAAMVGLGWVLWWWNELRYAIPQMIRCSRNGTKLPRGHMGLPFFGETLSFLWYFKVLRRPDDFIAAKKHKYGDGQGMYRTHMLGSPAIIVCSPMMSKMVLQSEKTFKLDWPAVEIVGKKSLVAVHGVEHARYRTFVSRTINSPDSLRTISIMVQPRVIAALKSWAEKGRVVVSREAKKVTFANIGKYFAGFEDAHKLDTLSKLFAGMVNGFRCYPIDLPGTTYRHALQCRRKAVAIFREELERRKRNPHEIKDRNDMMDGFMNLKDEQGDNLCDVQVLDNIVSLVVAGYESTSLSIMWALYYLAKYPKVLQKLRDENLKVSKSKENGKLITSDDISKMKYTNKVVEETIRLANIAAFVLRTTTKETVYRGYTIPKNWKVILWLRYLHTDPNNFEDPMCFNPDRWNESPKPGTYAVFGGGSRICAGNMLARLQVSILIHHLVIGYKWELVNPEAEISYLPHPKPTDGVEILINKI